MMKELLTEESVRSFKIHDEGEDGWFLKITN